QGLAHALFLRRIEVKARIEAVDVDRICAKRFDLSGDARINSGNERGDHNHCHSANHDAEYRQQRTKLVLPQGVQSHAQVFENVALEEFHRPSTVNRETGNRESGIRNREPGTENRELETGNHEFETERQYSFM